MPSSRSYSKCSKKNTIRSACDNTFHCSSDVKLSRRNSNQSGLQSIIARWGCKLEDFKRYSVATERTTAPTRMRILAVDATHANENFGRC
eukprot:6200357-Pleurochrysis_carterae.AAC.7